MNLSVIAFGAMTGLMIVFVTGIVFLERASKRTNFPKSDVEDKNPFESAD
jgi:hypothetical protein